MTRSSGPAPSFADSANILSAIDSRQKHPKTNHTQSDIGLAFDDLGDRFPFFSPDVGDKFPPPTSRSQSPATAEQSPIKRMYTAGERRELPCLPCVRALLNRPSLNGDCFDCFDPDEKVIISVANGKAWNIDSNRWYYEQEALDFNRRSLVKGSTS
ncbi:hypothetical protein MY3296_008506 [Beauveria thailandica]